MMCSKSSAERSAITPCVPSSPSRSGQGITGRRANLAVCLVPLLLVGATCAGAALQRTFTDRDDRAFGHMTRANACQVAQTFFQRLNGTTPLTYDTSMQSAYSVRRRSVVREWSVQCATSAGDYLLRINADTGRVYAINRMDDPGYAPCLSDQCGSGDDGSYVADEPTGPTITHEEAEARARDYVRLIGVSPKDLHIVVNHSQAWQTNPGAGEAEWNFTFQNAARAAKSHPLFPGTSRLASATACSSSTNTHIHLVTISIRSRDGGLQHLWNPLFSL